MVRILCKAAWGDGRAGGRGGREVVAGPCPYPRGGGSTAAPSTTPHCPPNCSGTSMSTGSSVCRESGN